MGLFDWLGGEDETTTQTRVEEPKFTQAPDYAESEAARGNWWKTLQDWGSSGSFGAVMPNFEDVYKNAAKRVSQYYWGGPSGQTGLMDKIRAGAARRGVAESPAIDVLTQRAGAEEAGKLGDISANLDVTKAQAVESARTNWLQSMMNLAGLKPSGTWGGTTTQTTTQPGEDLFPSLLSGGISLAGNLMQANTLKDLNKQNLDFWENRYGAPTQTQGSLTDRGVNNSFTDFGKTALDIGSFIPGPQQPFVVGANMLSDLFLN